MNPSCAIIENGGVAVKGEKIVWVGEMAHAGSRFKARQVLEMKDKVIIPGLINAHGHWAMTLFRGLVEDCTLDKWLAKIWRVEAEAISEENVTAGSQLAMVEMIRSGTTCAADMYWHYLPTTRIAQEAGFRIFSGPSFADIQGFEDYRHTNEAIAIAYIDTFKNAPLVHCCIQAHSTYMTNADILNQVAKLSADHNLVFVTHASESLWEIDLVDEKWGKTPIQVLDQFGLLGTHTLLAHCVHLSDDEISRLAETGTSVVHCPTSNLKLSSGIARVADLVEAGVNVAIGTDGAASNNDLDLFSEAQLAALMQKGVSGDPTVLPTQKVFAMLTIDGARALGIADKIGSIEVGKLADLVVVDFSTANLTPCYDPYANLIYALSAADITHVMINGQMVMKDRELRTLDEEAIKAKVRKIAEDIRGM